METQVQLPPSWRDFEVYRLVKVQQKSTRATAKELGISQSRIRQVIERVAAFLIETTPGADDPERRERGLFVAEQVAAERVNFLYGLAVRSFQRSKGVHETIREIEVEGKPTVTIGITREEYGDIRILMSAAKLAHFATKLPMPMLAAGIEIEEVEDEEEAADEEVESVEETDLVGQAMVNHPNGQCSATSGEQGLKSAEDLEATRVSLLQKVTSLKEKLERVGREKLLKAPVQLPSSSQASPPSAPENAAG